MRVLREMTGVELQLFLREPITVVFVLVLPVVVLVILNGIFGNAPAEFYDGLGAIDYYTPAYVALIVATIGVLSLPVQLAGYRERGVLRRLRASAMPVAVVVGAQVLVAVIIGGATAALLTALSTLAYGGSPPDDWIGAVLAFLLVTVAFAAVGVLLGVLLPTARAAQGVGVLLFFVFLNLGGAGAPAAILPETMATVQALVPLTPATTLLRGPWLGLGWDAGAAAVLVGMLAVSVGVIAWRLHRE